MKISVVLGTRPEIIKMSPIIRECERLGLDYFVLHIGQHYSYSMDRPFSLSSLSCLRPSITWRLVREAMLSRLARCLLVQEETCILRVPCVTLRDNTERPETLDVGSNVLAGTNPDKIVDCVKLMLGEKNDWENPFGDGKAGKRIIEILRHEFD